jgi:hypothetical protein
LLSAIALFQENLRGSGFVANPHISLAVLGIYGAFCLGFGYIIGLRAVEKQDAHNSTEDSVE